MAIAVVYQCSATLQHNYTLYNGFASRFVSGTLTLTLYTVIEFQKHKGI